MVNYLIINFIDILDGNRVGFQATAPPAARWNSRSTCIFEGKFLQITGKTLDLCHRVPTILDGLFALR